MRKNTPTNEKFWGRVKIGGSDDCWLWTGPTTNAGYGIGHLGIYHTTAHRLAWISLIGNPSSGVDVAHSCANKTCCNPAHLYLSSRLNNMLEVISRDDYAYPSFDMAKLQIIQNKARIYHIKRILMYEMETISDDKLLAMSEILLGNKVQISKNCESYIMDCGHSSKYLVKDYEGNNFCLYCKYNDQQIITRLVNKFLESVKTAIK